MIKIHFVDTDEETHLGPPYTVENLADLVSAALDIKASDYMATCRTYVYESSGNKISIFRIQDLQPWINNRSGELNIFIESKGPTRQNTSLETDASERDN